MYSFTSHAHKRQKLENKHRKRLARATQVKKRCLFAVCRLYRRSWGSSCFHWQRGRAGTFRLFHRKNYFTSRKPGQTVQKQSFGNRARDSKHGFIMHQSISLLPQSPWKYCVLTLTICNLATRTHIKNLFRMKCRTIKDLFFPFYELMNSVSLRPKTAAFRKELLGV